MNPYKKLMHRYLRTKSSFVITYEFSHLCNFLYKKLSKKVQPLADFKTLKELEQALEDYVWNVSEFKPHLFKSPHTWMKDAEIVQYELKTGSINSFRPDEFATYACSALQGIEEVSAPCVLSVRWREKTGQIQSHNVAVYKYATQKLSPLYGMIGSWGHFRGFNSVAQIATQVARIGGGKLIAYAVASPELKLIYHEQT